MTGFDKMDVLTSRDARGWVTNLLDFLPMRADQMKNVHIVSMEPGAVRGNHFHRRQSEAIFAIGSVLRVKAINRDTGEQYEEVIGPDAPVLFIIQPGVSHAFRNESNTQSHLVCFADRKYDFEKPDLNHDPILD